MHPMKIANSPLIKRALKLFFTVIPLCGVIAQYRYSFLLRDVIAGIVLTAVLVPVGMGYAQASGLPAITGLYATIPALLAYALFGPSRIMILGPDSALPALIATTILPLAQGDLNRAISLAGALAIAAGTVCVVLGIARFGFITDLISKPIRHGYLNAIAIILIISQLPKILGFPSNGGSLIEATKDIIFRISENQVNFSNMAIGLLCLLSIIFIKAYSPKLPAVLLSVIAATVIVGIFDLSTTANIAVVGPLPQGLPQFRIPDATLSDYKALAGSALAIALVSFADTSVLSRTLAMRGGYKVDSNQEIIALGISNIATGLFQGFYVSSSVSRTQVAEASGAHSQIAGIVGAFCIALLLIYAPNLLQSLPHAALGAIVIAACMDFMEIKEVKRLYKARRGEFMVSTACFLGVLFMGVIEGIFLSITLALGISIWRAWRLMMRFFER